MATSSFTNQFAAFNEANNLSQSQLNNVIQALQQTPNQIWDVDQAQFQQIQWRCHIARGVYLFVALVAQPPLCIALMSVIGQLLRELCLQL